jgi:predicted transcriptional regulator
MAQSELSINLNPRLSRQVKQTARKLHKDIDWIITHAVMQYLFSVNRELLAKEAKRQSLLVSRRPQSQEEREWEENSDTEGWV